MDKVFTYDEASTPLAIEEQEQLRLSYITNRDELNEAEQNNILQARNWAFQKKRNVLDEKFLKTLHKEMFNDVWKWAGKYRTTQRNIGIEAYRISIELNALISDVSFWVENETFPIDEIAARFHHKLVFIHPFPNGNGRFSRLATDLFLKHLGFSPFTWGEHLGSPGKRRKEYINALRAADNHDLSPLLEFVKK